MEPEAALLRRGGGGGAGSGDKVLARRGREVRELEKELSRDLARDVKDSTRFRRRHLRVFLEGEVSLLTFGDLEPKSVPGTCTLATSTNYTRDVQDSRYILDQDIQLDSMHANTAQSSNAVAIRCNMPFSGLNPRTDSVSLISSNLNAGWFTIAFNSIYIPAASGLEFVSTDASPEANLFSLALLNSFNSRLCQFRIPSDLPVLDSSHPSNHHCFDESASPRECSWTWCEHNAPISAPSTPTACRDSNEARKPRIVPHPAPQTITSRPAANAVLSGEMDEEMGGGQGPPGTWAGLEFLQRYSFSEWLGGLGNAPPGNMSSKSKKFKGVSRPGYIEGGW
ncbi:hypothetical protein C8R44DRAFT_738419 [Mycena epipterygia]|nr:hypothetical protein C8R44DRAFT_738419 [Mycena epipterygia]